MALKITFQSSNKAFRQRDGPKKNLVPSKNFYTKKSFLEINKLDITDDGRRTDNRIDRRSFERTGFASKSVIIWENFCKPSNYHCFEALKNLFQI